jgi:hypothetical protein
MKLSQVVSGPEVDDTNKGLIRSIGDAGASPSNITGKTLLYLMNILLALFAINVVSTTTALGASATYTSSSEQESTYGTGMSRGYIRAMAISDQAGTLYIDQSVDGSHWDKSDSQAMTAGTVAVLAVQLYGQFWRLRIVNGGTAEGYLRASSRSSIA